MTDDSATPHEPGSKPIQDIGEVILREVFHLSDAEIEVLRISPRASPPVKARKMGEPKTAVERMTAVEPKTAVEPALPVEPKTAVERPVEIAPERHPTLVSPRSAADELSQCGDAMEPKPMKPGEAPRRFTLPPEYEEKYRREVAEEAGHYDDLIEWQGIILSGGDKPPGLTAQQSAEFDAFAEELTTMSDMGYVIDVPND